MWQLKFLIYLFEVSLSSWAFYALYAIFLKRLTFFKLNRIYLLSALLFSFVIPTVNIEVQQTEVSLPAPSRIADQVEHLKTVSANPIVSNNHAAFSLTDLIFYGYTIVALLLLAKGLSAVFELLKHTRKVSEQINGLTVIYKYSGFVNCSFFHYVFIDPTTVSAEETEMLLQHELVHARQWHSADKLFLLICKTILWFNPLIYLYDMALEQAHEYEADGAALKTEGIKTYAQLLIRMAGSRPNHVFTHYFGKHPVKERIQMLLSDRSTIWSVSAYACAIPVCLSLISVFSIRVVAAYPLSEPAYTLILDAGHGGTDAGARSGSVTEKQLTLSFVKKIGSLAASRGLKVISTRNDDSSVSLKNRGNTRGDILISIHYNSSADPGMSGIEILSGNSPIPSRRAMTKDLIDHLYQNLRLLQGIHTKNISREVTGSYLLEHSTAPSVMLELGYLSNASDKNYISSGPHQNELAMAIVNSVIASRDAQAQHQK